MSGLLVISWRARGALLSQEWRFALATSSNLGCFRCSQMASNRTYFASARRYQQPQEIHDAAPASLPEAGSEVNTSKFSHYLEARKKDLDDSDDKSGMSSTAFRKEVKKERRVLRLEDRKRRLQDRKRAAMFARKRILRREAISNDDSSVTLSQRDMNSWKETMSNELVKQDDYNRAESQEEQANSSAKADTEERASNKETTMMDNLAKLSRLAERKKYRASLLAKTISVARSKQQQSSSEEFKRNLPSRAAIQGPSPKKARLTFDRTEISYPPSDIYPPPIPILSDSDPIAAARALGIVKSCEVEWDAKSNPPEWRKTYPTNEYYENHDLIEYLDNEQALEFLGDSVLHLLSRSLIMDRFPGKSVYAYNMASSWLVSNGCFAYMYEDSGLVEERIQIAKVLMDISKKRQIQSSAHSLSEEERKHQEEASVGEPVLPNVLHLRKADFFEAYVGAVYLTLGFASVSKWIEPLLDPWLDAIGRTPSFHQDFLLSASGEAEKRATLSAKLRAEEEERNNRNWWEKIKAKWFKKD